MFVQAFESGDAAAADAEAVRAVLRPHAMAPADTFGFVRLETADGGADLYGYDRLESGFMVNHIEGTEVWDLIVRAAAADKLVIMPVGCPVCVTDEKSISDLPEPLDRGACVVRSGQELRELIASAP